MLSRPNVELEPWNMAPSVGRLPDRSAFKQALSRGGFAAEDRAAAVSAVEALVEQTIEAAVTTSRRGRRGRGES